MTLVDYRIVMVMLLLHREGRNTDSRAVYGVCLLSITDHVLSGSLIEQRWRDTSWLTRDL